MTADVALYGHWICPFATRVQFALHQRAIPHELVDVPPSGVRGPDFELPPESFVEHSSSVWATIPRPTSRAAIGFVGRFAAHRGNQQEADT